MADDDEVGEEPDFDPTFATAGPRRSTFTPPPTRADDDTVHDDDALADALAAAFGSPVTASVPTDPASTDLPFEATLPYSPAVPAPGPPPWSSLPAPDPSQAVDLPDGPPVRRSLPDDQLTQWVETAGQQPGGTLDVIEQLETQMRLRQDEAREFTAWEDRMRSLGTPEAISAVEQARPDFTGVLPPAPAPVTGQFVQPDTSSEWPAPDFGPRLTPAEQYAPTAPAETDSVSDIVPEPAVDEQPAQISEPEPYSGFAPHPVTGFGPADTAISPVPDRAVWPTSDAAVVPTPEVIDELPPEVIDELPPVAPDPFTPPAAEQVPEPVEPVALPTWGVPAPSANWAPSDDPEPAAAEPDAAPVEPAPEPVDSVTSDSAPVDAAPVDAPPVDAAGAFDWATPSEPAPDVEAPSNFTWATSADDVVIEPTIDPETGPVDDPTESEPELTLEAEPDTEAPFTPPPLIEPLGFGGPPILPSQAKSFPAAGTLAGDEAGHSFDFRPDAPVPTATAAAAFTFDDLLSGAATDENTVVADDADVESAEEPPLHPDPEPTTVEDASPEALFIEPMSFSAGEPVPVDTGSITVVDQAYDEDVEDDVDETDRIFPGFGAVSVDTAGIAAVHQPISPPSGPISTVRIRDDEQVLFDDEPIPMRVFSLEPTGPEPTPVDHRVGRAARLFWLWFAANSSILSLGLGAAVFAVGMSLRQSIVSVLAGVALSFIPLGLTTLAGKRSGQPTMIVSRATFGLIGNVFPAVVALITRLFWGAVLLWLLGSSIAIILVGAELNGALGERLLLLISLGGTFLIALVVAFAGYPLLARIQLVLSCISGVLVVGLIVLTARYIDIPQALTAPDGPWLLTITGAVLVFSFVGLVWANSGADLARYQRPTSSGASSMLWATFGTTLPSFLLIGYGALLAASDPGIASGFLLSPLDTLALMLPIWYPIPLLAAAGLSLLSGIIISIYSGGFALQSIGVRVPRQVSVVIVGVLLAGIALLIAFGVTGGINELFRDVATTLAVPTAAWAGIFAAETMIRNRRFESQSLLVRGGVYPDVRWANLIGLFLITAIGFGLTTATVGWLTWQGYGFGLLGIPLDSDLAGTDLGVLVALVLGLVVPIVTGIPAIRKQEAMRV